MIIVMNARTILAIVPTAVATVPTADVAAALDCPPGTLWTASSSVTRRSASIVITWPRKYGGRDATLLQWVVYEEEYFRAGAPGRASANGTYHEPETRKRVARQRRY